MFCHDGSKCEIKLREPEYRHDGHFESDTDLYDWLQICSALFLDILKSSSLC